MESECQILAENLRQHRLFYEIHPALAGGGEQEWFEVALHVEVREYRPHDHPETRKRSILLIDVADHLVQRVRSEAPFALEMPHAYYTLHPGGTDNQNQPRMALSLNVIFTGLRPCRSPMEPALLTQVRAELTHLGIPGCGWWCAPE